MAEKVVIKIDAMGTAGMLQSVEFLPRKHENLSSGLQLPGKSQYGSVCPSIIPMLGDGDIQRLVELGSSLASQPS